MTNETDEAETRAGTVFARKEAQAREASKAMAEYQAGVIAEREKTARLRALRLAREAAEAAARAAGTPVTAPAAPKPAVSAEPVTKARRTPSAKPKASAKKAVAPIKKRIAARRK